MTKCPKCDYVSPRDAQFCYRDGTAMENYRKACPCGYVGDSRDKYCEDCGKEITESK